MQFLLLQKSFFLSHFRYFLQLAYKGTQYCGWQVQPNGVSVQEKLNGALQTVLKNKGLETIGCGRTDTGVHASEFFVHFDHFEPIEDQHRFVYKVNALLPKDIAANKLIAVAQDAHTRFDATKREYKYFIHFNKDPFIQETSVYQHLVPDLDLMNEAATWLLSVTDFTSFAKLHADSKTNICRLYHAQWEKTGTGICFTICANRFLRNMVRAIVGTLLMVGQKKISLAEFKNIVDSKSRSNAGMSVAAHGLFLTRVEYPYL